MRDIKFRAWDKKSSQMVEVGIIDWGVEGKLLSINHPYGKLYNEPNTPIHLMQYTGLKDKNSVEIYEGDIVKGYAKATSEVFFRNGSFMTYLNNGSYLEISQNGLRDNFEVVGNIYENKELLK